MEEPSPQMTVGPMPLGLGVPVTYLTPFSIAGAKTQRREIRAFLLSTLRLEETLGVFERSLLVQNSFLQNVLILKFPHDKKGFKLITLIISFKVDIRAFHSLNSKVFVLRI